MLKNFLLTILTLSYSLSLFSQTNLIERNASSNVKQELQKLLTTTTVLYLAAHPDDENTRLISYFANEKMARTAYLSLTRGDGGQNLIGTEKGPSLGLLRTQELLSARSIDCGEQFFTRAIDFGYSKTAKETFGFWKKEEVLKDVVLVIRRFRPDVIITRFPPTEYAGHGHHTASAMLAAEAFDLAADQNAFPEQFEAHGVEPWKVKRLYFNASSWWNKDLPELAKSSDDYLTLDIGKYNPVLGLSYGEMAAESRSQHKSQGFGAARQRGEVMEYLQYQKGEKASNNDVLNDIPSGWNRYGKGGKKIHKALKKALKSYKPDEASACIKSLFEARELMMKLPNFEKDGLLKAKINQLDEVVFSICGIYAELTIEQPYGVPGEEVNYTLSIINRSNVPVQLKSAGFLQNEINPSATLIDNDLNELKGSVIIPEKSQFSNPYWLNHDATYLYQLDKPELTGLPEYHPYKAKIKLQINGKEFDLERLIEYRRVDREKGELYQPFVVLPAVTCELLSVVKIFNAGKAEKLELRVNNHLKGLEGKIKLHAADGWRISPEVVDYKSESDEGEAVYVFEVTPPSETSSTTITASIEIDGNTYDSQLDKISYDHIVPQHWLHPTKTEAINLNIKKAGERIAYVMGAGDELPENLRQIGYEVNLLDPLKINSTDLSAYDAVIVGIRAYNTIPELVNTKAHLLNYMNEGGKVIVQYQTSRGIDANDFSPYPLVLDRDRVTDENAEVRRLIPDHSIFHYPNELTSGDFENWVQERGLYFGSEWDEHFVAPIGWNDDGEASADGGLLVADYGKGAFIYTGISFFRQIPAGVPGAFRLLANIISYEPKTENGK